MPFYPPMNEFRIQPILFEHIWNKHTLNSIKKKNTICLFLFHTTVLQYTQSRIHGPKLESFLSAVPPFAGSGSGTLITEPSKSSGSMRIRIHNTGFICRVFTCVFYIVHKIFLYLVCVRFGQTCFCIPPIWFC